MKVIGIEIAGRKIQIVALDKTESGIKDSTGSYKPIVLQEDEIAKNVQHFRDTIFATLDSFSPDVIVIKYRNPKGKGMMAPSPISFKIEGLIQTYKKCPILFTKPQTIAAYFKKNELPFKPKYTYQSEALKLAVHYIHTN